MTCFSRGGRGPHATLSSTLGSRTQPRHAHARTHPMTRNHKPHSHGWVTRAPPMGTLAVKSRGTSGSFETRVSISPIAPSSSKHMGLWAKTLGTSSKVYVIHPLIHSSTRGPTRTPSETSCSQLPLPPKKAMRACSNAAHRVGRALVAVVHTLVHVGYRLLEPKC